MKYLLPCDRCGEKTPIDASQAGRQIVCQCGAALEVPSFRAVRELERFDEPQVKQQRSWNPFRGTLFALGLVLVALGLAAAAGCGIGWAMVDTTEPPAEDLEPVLKAIDAVGPSDSWDIWVDMRDKGLGPYYLPEHVMARRGAQNLRWLMMIGLAVAATGVVISTGSLLIAKKRRS